MNTGEWVAWAESELGRVSETARLEAELLLAESAGLSRASIMAYPERPLGAAQSDRLIEAVRRRARGEPFAYIAGQREFFGLRLAVDTRVLVPRPETELLVELALAQWPEAEARVLDLGTGSGAIALALKHERPEFSIVAVDRSESALALARRNAADLQLEIRFAPSDWFAALAGERFDLIVANPPYVPSDDPHFASALRYEPRLALDGGRDGLDAYRAILAAAANHLRPRGALLFEHGFDQREALIALAAEFEFGPVAVGDDLAGHPRAVALARHEGD